MNQSQQIKSTGSGQYQLDNLTAKGLAPRESQALLLLANGYSHKAAAEELGCGVKTIEGRIKSLFYKLKAYNGPQLIANAFKQGHLILEG